MHIYHYANYEIAALKRLMLVHGTRETAVDDLLRRGKLVDLFAVVREGIRASTQSYSLKDIERFYMPAREGEVTTPGRASSYYERWRASRDQAELDKIETYNAVDCESTHLLRDWLLAQTPARGPSGTTGPWGGWGSEQASLRKTRSVEEQLAKYARHPPRRRTRRAQATGPSSTTAASWCCTSSISTAAATSPLVEDIRAPRHGRDELIDDVECIGGLRAGSSVDCRCQG